MIYPADPPTVEEIIAVMRQANDNRHGWRLRALIVVLWRGGLRIQEALALTDLDLDPRRGSLLVRHGKGGRRREIGMDAWGWEQAAPLAGLSSRSACRAAVLRDRRSDPWASLVKCCRARLELAREGMPLNIIQRQLGHANLGTTSVYLQGIDTEEIIAAVHTRRAPMMSATAGLRL
jgi:site-specific recombinase XerD